eukprot:CAMPEP_0118944992 /NCGR_PEP_ID=MMETSP1169-20130426/41417_1 /TAXON_ID=36882 /ORGANISM="Pyramimonas obovata, Strain CCMP722" /LENGTH=59 /DNA_ID=CAMNT_0006890611 /DNA_START=218 /DNA_END=394 /DNA_ORIENTATION=+
MQHRLLGLIVTWWADHTHEMMQQAQASKAAADLVGNLGYGKTAAAKRAFNKWRDVVDQK